MDNEKLKLSILLKHKQREIEALQDERAAIWEQYVKACNAVNVCPVCDERKNKCKCVTLASGGDDI